MQFLNTILSAAVVLASMTAANMVKFVNQDATTRHIVFTSSLDKWPLPDLVIPGLKNATQVFPTGYIGNFWSHNEGSSRVTGKLGEVAFDGWQGKMYYDVSAVDNKTDLEGVKMLFAEGDKTITSGCSCQRAGTICANEYNIWDDVQTKVSDKASLTCLLGNPPAQRCASRRRSTNRRTADVFYPRSYVLGEVAPQ